jgi:FkbM family methyltransferase
VWLLDTEKLKQDAAAAGFRNAPFALLLHTLRRFLWPLVRQYHFFTLEKLSDLDRHLEARIQAVQSEFRLEIEKIAGQNTSRDAHIGALQAEAGKAAFALAKLQSDLIATANHQNQTAAGLEELQHLAGRPPGPAAAAAPRHQAGEKTHLPRNGAPPSALFLKNVYDGVFILKSGDLISDYVAQTGRWDEHVLPIIAIAARRRPEVAVDVGAHFGLLSAAMARQFRRVLSFEPNDFNFRLLRANMSLNGLSSVECHNIPLYSKAVVLSLSRREDQEIPLPLTAAGEFDGEAATNLGAFSFSEAGTANFSKPARTLDSFALPELSLLKIDAQGADGEILMGARETLRRCRPIIIFEWSMLLARQFNSSLEDITRLLCDLNYDVQVLKAVTETQVDYLAIPRDSPGQPTTV